MMDSVTNCPLCGGPNDCGVAAGKDVCWCFSAGVPSEVVERIPDSLTRLRLRVLEVCPEVW